MSDEKKATILVVEDQEAEREAVARFLELEDYRVIAAQDPVDAIERANGSVDLVLSDLKMGQQDGIDLLRHFKRTSPHIPFLLMTAHADVNSAVEAMKLGAADYLRKPVNPDELLVVVERCLDHSRKDARLQSLEQRLDKRFGFEKIIGNSPPMEQIFEQARRAAQVDSTVLVLGESGTGKELIAEAIHHNSPRKDGPFVTINMAAVPNELVESELFGHVKGSFTGATESRKGKFEAADGGTLFIDEIGDFALSSQAKLLRVLENSLVTRVGSNDQKKVDVRVVAATSRDLAAMVSRGEFREDLFYRLNVVMLRLPPLRDRREDIPLLVNHFVSELCEEMGRERLGVAPPLMKFFEEFDWPGNVRQLRNAIESMVVLASGEQLTLDNVPASLQLTPKKSDAAGIPSGVKLHELERAAVEKTAAIAPARPGRWGSRFARSSASSRPGISTRATRTTSKRRASRRSLR